MNSSTNMSYFRSFVHGGILILWTYVGYIL